MLGKPLYLTQAGFDKMSEELIFIRTTRRNELSKEIGAAIEQGDIKENAEYDAAKDAQGLNEARIAELELKMSNVKIIDEMDIPSDKIYIGATATVENVETKEVMERTLLSADEADVDKGIISISSPIGQGLLGHAVDDLVEINIPAGLVKYKILKIERRFKKAK